MKNIAKITKNRQYFWKKFLKNILNKNHYLFIDYEYDSEHKFISLQIPFNI